MRLLFAIIAFLSLAQTACREKPTPEASHAALLQPETATAQAPAVYKAKFITTKGEFVIMVRREWSPLGADRFFHLVQRGYYDNVAMFRAVKGFMVQLGLHGSPTVNQKWRNAQIQDDPKPKFAQSNKRGYVTFAKAGPNSRTTQFFINFVDNSRLDPSGFTPFGQVISGMEVVDKINTQYGDAPSGPNQTRILDEGNAYLDKEFPNLDYVRMATIVD